MKKALVVFGVMALLIGVALVLRSKQPTAPNATTGTGPTTLPTATTAVATTSQPQVGTAPATTPVTHQKTPIGFDPVKDHTVRADANPQVSSVAEALKSKAHPERLSPVIRPKEFDPVAYRNNPRAYLDVAEPGRMFMSAQPAANVPRISLLTPQLQDTEPGKSVTLKVRAAPKWPLTFSSVDLGQFQNGLTTITVEANEAGEAETTFYASKGTTNSVRILAASPMASGQATFFVNIKNAKAE